MCTHTSLKIGEKMQILMQSKCVISGLNNEQYDQAFARQIFVKHVLKVMLREILFN